MSEGKIIIAGAGVIGLALAWELASQGHSVVMVEQHSAGRAASWVAAGMLAPFSEHIPLGPYLDLCCRSLDLYAEWSQRLSTSTGMPSGYWPCGILQPLTEPPTHFPASFQGSWRYLDRLGLDNHQAGLHPDVNGAFWCPAEGCVDNRLLVSALLAAVRQAGVRIFEQTEIVGWQVNSQRVLAMDTTLGSLQGDTYVVALGAWAGLHRWGTGTLPVAPRKGQILTVQAGDLSLRHVLYGESVYLVPRQDGRILIGATVETVGFTPGNTAEAVAALLQAAIDLYPPIAPMPLVESTWGFRPSSPDREPILGQGPLDNLILATGHDRNGILLAPLTAQLISRFITRHQTDPLLREFAWNRPGLLSPLNSFTFDYGDSSYA